jgi:pimeloyl-ACP methyl ester carboxylesterase
MYTYVVEYIPWIKYTVLFTGGFVMAYNLFHKLHWRNLEDTDNSDYRRQKGKIYGLDEAPDDIIHEYGWVPNIRGNLLFYQKWLPLPSKPVTSVVVLCHGFGDHSAGFLRKLAVKFAKLDYGVVAIDYIGHGRSDGLHALITSVDDLAADVANFMEDATIHSERLRDKKVFLYGESLGGAVAFKLCTSTNAKKYIKGVNILFFLSALYFIHDVSF